MSEINLSEVIKQLRAELATTMKEGGEEDLRFELKNLEVEMQVVVTEEVTEKSSVGGGIKFWVLDAKAGAESADKFSSARTHKIKLSLMPKSKSGRDMDLSG